MNGQAIPGYFWDAEKKKYFRIQNQTAAQGSNLKYSSENIRKTERKEHIQNVAIARSNKIRKERVVRRNPNTFAQTNLDREYVGQKFTPKDCSAIWGAAARPSTFTPSPGVANTVAATWSEHLAVAASSSMLLFARSQAGAWDSQTAVKSLDSDVLALEWISYTTVALGCRNGNIRLYDTRSGGSSHVLTHPSPVSKLKRADDETRLICSGLQDTLFLYDIRAPRLSRNASRKTLNYENHHYNEEYFRSLYPTHRDGHKRRKLNHKAFKNWSQPVLTFEHANREELDLDIDVHPRLGLLAAAQDKSTGTAIRISNIWTGKTVKEIKTDHATKHGKMTTHDPIRSLKFIDRYNDVDGGVDLWSCWNGGIAKFGWGDGSKMKLPESPDTIMPQLDIEKGATMTDSKYSAPSSHTNTPILKSSTFRTQFSTTIPLMAAYISLYLTNYYLSPSGPGFRHRSNDSGRICPLVAILMLLAPDIIQKAFAATTASIPDESPCFGFGWLAFTVGLLVPVMRDSKSLLPREEEEEDVKVISMDVKKGELGEEQQIETRKIAEGPGVEFMATAVFQFCLAGLFWYCYRDLSVPLLLSTSILLVEATASLPIWSAQKPSSHAGGRQGGAYALMRDKETPPHHIFIIQPAKPDISNVQDTAALQVPYDHQMHAVSIPIFILISGGFLSQALLCTQLSDVAAVGMLAIMFCGTISNVAIAALPREPTVGGMKFESVDVIVGKSGVVGALREVETRLEGYGEVLVRQCFPEKLGEWEGRKEKVLRMIDVGNMD
ncbi:unnamed protein product [Alternaria alternata]